MKTWHWVALAGVGVLGALYFLKSYTGATSILPQGPLHVTTPPGGDGSPAQATPAPPWYFARGALGIK
jgi:hypothetical protein